MEDANTAVTPSATTPLFIDTDGNPFKETWDYATVIGMLMFLSTNSRPDIAYAVHQCARFTHCPRESHAKGVKRILRYLKGTKTGGMKLEPSGKLNVDCYVDCRCRLRWYLESRR